MNEANPPAGQRARALAVLAFTILGIVGMATTAAVTAGGGGACVTVYPGGPGADIDSECRPIDHSFDVLSRIDDPESGLAVQALQFQWIVPDAETAEEPRVHSLGPEKLLDAHLPEKDSRSMEVG